MVTLKHIEQASKILKNVVYKTPLVYSFSLSELTGVNLFLKLENLQRTGSFKIRGAYNKLHKIKRSFKNIIAASAGNHAQGVALASKLLGVKATIVMPDLTPINKILATKHYGADVVLHGNNFEEAYAYAKLLEGSSTGIFIHPFDDPAIIAGQGTIGLELIEVIQNLEAVFVPIGGGGLISGISIALKENNPKIKVIGVQSAAFPSMLLSREKGRVVEIDSKETIAEGIAIKMVGAIPSKIIQDYVDDIITVEEHEIENALLLLTERKKILVEGAGAVSLAGILKTKENFYKKNTAIIVSGGNIDIKMLAKIIERGLMKSGRSMKLELELADVPGSLAKLATLLGAIKANIVQIFHERFSRNLQLNKAIVEISLETRGYEHQEEILKLLRENGYNPKGIEPYT
ncbi:MAG TPA: threonine ammonia-lyase [Thermodesulfobacteriota bacterium]|jgi:threonine dehydratase